MTLNNSQIEKLKKMGKSNLEIAQITGDYESLENLYSKDQEIEEKMKSCNEKFPNQCHCAFRCLTNDFCQDAEKYINELKEENSEMINNIRKILSTALDELERLADG